MAYAVESYLYKYMEYTTKSNELISYINENNPDAKIVIFGHFNPIRNANLSLGDSSMNLGKMFELMSLASTMRSISQYKSSKNSTFVYISDAESVYDSMAASGEAESDMFGFLTLLLGDKGILYASPESDEYIASQMMSYVIIDCDHKYDNDCDAICNKCFEERYVPHLYDGCIDASCNLCDAVRETSPHVLSDCLDGICDVCAQETIPIGHSFGEWIVTKEAGKNTDGEQVRICSACGLTESKGIPAISAGSADIFIVIAVVLVLCGVGFGIYWFVFKKKPGATPATEENAGSSASSKQSECDETVSDEESDSENTDNEEQI